MFLTGCLVKWGQRVNLRQVLGPCIPTNGGYGLGLAKGIPGAEYGSWKRNTHHFPDCQPKLLYWRITDSYAQGIMQVQEYQSYRKFVTYNMSLLSTQGQARTINSETDVKILNSVIFRWDVGATVLNWQDMYLSSSAVAYIRKLTLLTSLPWGPVCLVTSICPSIFPTNKNKWINSGKYHSKK